MISLLKRVLTVDAKLSMGSATGEKKARALYAVFKGWEVMGGIVCVLPTYVVLRDELTWCGARQSKEGRWPAGRSIGCNT